MAVFEISINEKEPIAIDVKNTDQIEEIGENEYFTLQENRSHHGVIQKIDAIAKTVTLKLNENNYVCKIEESLDITLRSLNLSNKNKQVSANLISSMPGLVLKVLVSENQPVEKGEPLMILEAMKMENILKAAHGGRINKICCHPGDAVDKGQLLIEIEA